MVTLKLKRLPAASIVETIVALTIILVLFGISTTVLVQTGMYSPSVQKLRAGQLMNQILVDTKEERRFFDEEINEKDLKARKQVVAYEGKNNLVKVTVIILDLHDSTIVTVNRIMRTN